jgi:hypothetical protein
MRAILLYGPNAETSVRTQTLDKSIVLGICGIYFQELYQGRMKLTEQLTTRKWDIVGSIGNGELSGIIPQKHRARPAPEILSQFIAYNLRIQEAGLKT